MFETSLFDFMNVSEKNYKIGNKGICLNHSRPLELFSTWIWTTKNLWCSECLKKNKDISLNDHLLEYNELIMEITKTYEKIRKTSTIKINIPKDWSDLTKNHEKLKKAIKDNIENQKVACKDLSKKINEEITSIIEKKIESNCYDLDEQYKLWETGYDCWLDSFKKFFETDAKENLPISPKEIEKILDTLVFDSEQFDLFLKKIQHNQTLLTLIYDTTIKNSNAINDYMMKQSNVLIFQYEYLLSTSLIEPSKILENFTNSLSLMNNESLIAPIFPIALSNIEYPIESKILSPGKLDFIYFKGNKIQLTMLYQGTRDGFNANSFHENCDGFSPILVIILNNNLKTFGGYIDTGSKPNLSFKNSQIGTENSFLFSCDEKKIFPKKSGDIGYLNEADSGPIFGHDLIISDEFDRNDSCVLRLGTSYLATPDDNISILGTTNSNFCCRELEVYKLDTVVKKISIIESSNY